NDLPPPGPTTDVPPPSSTPKTLMIIGFTAAGVGLVVGGITGFLANSKKSTLSDECPNNQCPPSAHDDLQGAKTMATLSTGGFILAGAGLTLGLIGLLTKPKAPSTETTDSSGTTSTPPSTETTAPSTDVPPPVDTPPPPTSSVKITPWVGFGTAG